MCTATPNSPSRNFSGRMNLLVFDSGIGGLGVVEQIRRLQPGASLTYLMDNSFFPYGEKPDAILASRILEMIGSGIDAAEPDAVVIACNTASTIALGHLRETFALPFIGCVPPIKPAAAASLSRQIGLLATPATIRRPYLAALIEKFAGDCIIHSLGTPLLADLAEQKFRGAAVDLRQLEAAIAPLFEQSAAIDAIALGCTHYTFLLPEFLRLHPGISWFDPALAVARQVQKVTAALPPTPNAATEMFLTSLPFRDHDVMAPRLAAYGFHVIKTLLTKA
jgi:glutamate racemase